MKKRPSVRAAVPSGRDCGYQFTTDTCRERPESDRMLAGLLRTPGVLPADIARILRRSSSVSRWMAGRTAQTGEHPRNHPVVVGLDSLRPLLDSAGPDGEGRPVLVIVDEKRKNRVSASSCPRPDDRLN